MEFKRYLYLGGRVSKKHEEYEKLSMLGYDEARKLAIVWFIRWRRKHSKAKPLELYEKLLELKGMAELMPTLKELTRISMILGDTSDIRDY